MIGSVINCFSGTFHSPALARAHYENFLQSREDGKSQQTPIPSKSIKHKKVSNSSGNSDKHKDKKLRGKTATLFQQDNNCQHSKHFRTIFDYLLEKRKTEERNRDMQLK